VFLKVFNGVAKDRRDSSATSRTDHHHITIISTKNRESISSAAHRDSSRRSRYDAETAAAYFRSADDREAARRWRCARDDRAAPGRHRSDAGRRSTASANRRFSKTR
jgi:hypothetical protein